MKLTRLHISFTHSWKLAFLTIVLFSFSGWVSGQNAVLDSLKKELKKTSVPDSLRMQTLLQLGNRLDKNNARAAKAYYQECAALAGKTKNYYFMGEAIKGIGAIYHYKQDYDSALYFYEQADSLFRRDSLSFESRALLKSLVGDVEKSRNNYEKAIKLHLEAVGLMKQSDNPDALAIIYSNIGGVYYDMGQYAKTLEYDLQSLEVHKKSNQSDYSIVNSELFVAGDYITLNKLSEAKLHIENAEQRTLQLNSPVLLCRVYGYWGSYFRAAKEYDSAIQSLEKSVIYARKTADVYHEMDGNRVIGQIYFKLHNYDKCLLFLNKALSSINQLKNTSLKVGVLKMLAEAHAALDQNREAVKFYEKYIDLNDSLSVQSTKIKINEIENKYQNKQKTDSITMLQKSTELQQLALHKKQNQNIFIISISSLLLLTAFLLYRNLRHKHRLLKKNEQIREQQIHQLEKEQQLNAAQLIMKGQEEERSRLAKDLHDGVGGLLSGVKLSLSHMEGNVFLSAAHANAVTTIIDQLDNSINELRRVSHNMMPEALIKYGLKEALENYCETIDQSGALKVRLQTLGLEHRLDQNTEIILYRIIQELLNNVIKHAEASQVLVQLILEINKFTLTVEDDGKGFDIHNQQDASGSGLQNIRARAGYLNGTVDIRTHPGEGTSVTIEGQIS